MSILAILAEPAPLRAALLLFRRAAQRPLSQTAAAKKLGVTREHLNRVLRGHRHSRRLTSAYQKLQRAA